MINMINIIKAIYEKPIAIIMLTRQKTTSISLKIGSKTGMSTFTFLIQHNTGSPSHSNQTRRNKSIQIGREEVKLSLFADEMILYIENSKDSTKNY